MFIGVVICIIPYLFDLNPIFNRLHDIISLLKFK
jgi:hypothetical protein